MGVLDDQPLGIGQLVGVLPIGDAIDLLLTKAQLTAERSSEIVSPHTPDQRASSQLGKRLEVLRQRPSSGYPSLHCQFAEKRRLVPTSGSVGGRHGRASLHHFEDYQHRDHAHMTR